MHDYLITKSKHSNNEPYPAFDAPRNRRPRLAISSW